MNENESKFIYLQKSKDYLTVICNTGDDGNALCRPD